MATFTSTYSLITLSFFLLISSANSFNITKILDTWSDYSTFNNLLTQTQVAAEINRRQTITVLAVSNDAMGSVSGQSQDVIKKIMSLHVVLDYYDPTKLQKLPNKTTLLTTLYQTSGLADNQRGFLNVSDVDGEVRLGSAVEGSSLDSKLVKSLASQSYNISVLQISSPIVPNGIASGKTNNTSSSPPAANAPKASAPSNSSPPAAKAPKASAPSKGASAPPSPPSNAPAASPKKAPPAGPPKSSKAPAPADATGVPAPADAPTGAADTPAGDTPVGAPSPTGAPGVADATPADQKSSSTRVGYGLFVVFVMVGFSSWIGL